MWVSFEIAFLCAEISVQISNNEYPKNGSVKVFK